MGTDSPRHWEVVVVGALSHFYSNLITPHRPRTSIFYIWGYLGLP